MTVRTAVGTDDEVSSRLLIVARDGSAVEAIRRALDGTTIHVVHVAASGADAISFLGLTDVDVVALVDLPPSEGVGLAREMYERWPDLGIVMMGPEDRDQILEAIRVGVREYVEDWYLDHLVEDVYQGHLFGAILRAAGRPW